MELLSWLLESDLAACHDLGSCGRPAKLAQWRLGAPPRRSMEEEEEEEKEEDRF